MHKMLRTAVLAFAGALLLSACSDPPTYLIRPADPDVAVRAPRYTTVTAGVKRYDVVEPKDWRTLNRQVAPKPGEGGMEGMPGMNGKSGGGGMEGMPGMGKPQGGGASQGGDSMDHSKMPGMNMPGMGGKRDTGGR